MSSKAAVIWIAVVLLISLGRASFIPEDEMDFRLAWEQKFDKAPNEAPSMAQTTAAFVNGIGVFEEEARSYDSAATEEGRKGWGHSFSSDSVWKSGARKQDICIAPMSEANL